MGTVWEIYTVKVCVYKFQPISYSPVITKKIITEEILQKHYRNDVYGR